MGRDNAFSGKDLHDVEEVARYLGVKQTTVYRWCREGRMSCFKIGKSWRIRSSAIEEFLRRGEQSVTLPNQLRQFVEVPSSIIAMAQNTELLHRLDAAFLSLGAERGALLVKFHGAEPDSEDELRDDFERHGLDVARLEQEGRLSFSAEKDPLEEREDALRGLLEEETDREVWVSCDWVERDDPEPVLEQQRRLKQLVDDQRLAIKTALLEEVADNWPMAVQRETQALHSGLVWVSDSGLALSRMLPLSQN
ncbi:MAG: helix-turn-helix domain-containing protein [Rubrobacteraceae bacterium]